MHIKVVNTRIRHKFSNSIHIGTLRILAIILLAATINVTFGQDLVCGTEDLALPLSTYSPDRNSGLYKTSSGHVHALVVFMRFPDDTGYSEDWSKWPSAGLEDWMIDFVDPTTVPTNNKYNITSFFREESQGNLILTGDAYHFLAPNPSSYYTGLSNRCYGLANREALIALHDSVAIDNSAYDTWSYNSSLFHNNLSNDGYYDLVLMVWRNAGNYWFTSCSGRTDDWSEIASLSSNSNHHDYSIGNMQVNGSGFFNSSEIPPSGLTMMVDGIENIHKLTIHEIGHFLIGQIHPYSNFGGRDHSFWSIFGTDENILSVNAYEKDMLGWISPNDITTGTTNQSIALADAASSGNALVYRTGIGNERFYIENRQGDEFYGYYDVISNNEMDRGLAILHLDNYYGNYNGVKTISSDGFWKWNKINDVTHPFGGSGVWHRLERSRPNVDISDAGYVGSHRDAFINPNGSKKQWAGVALNYLPNFDAHMSEIVALSDGYGNYYISEFYRGWAFKSSFDHVDRNRWSPFTNPSTRAWNGSQTGLDIQITGKTGSTLNLVINRNVSSSQIASNLTWKNLITLTENLTVKNGTTLTISPGTWVSVDEDVSIIVEDGAKIIANGTQSDPIRFTSMWDDKNWGGLKLLGDDNEFSWVIVAEADTGFSFRGEGNTLANSIVKGGDVGVKVKGYTATSTAAELEVQNVLIESLDGAGFIAQNLADLKVITSTVRGVSGPALHVVNSTVGHGDFSNNYIMGSGGSSSVPVVLVESGGYVTLVNWDTGYGYNRFDDDKGPVFVIDATSTLHAGYSLLDHLGAEIYREEGRNAVFPASGEYAVDNANGSIWSRVEYNYWGANPPSSGLFDGLVAYDPWLGGDPLFIWWPYTGVDEVYDLPDPDEPYEHKLASPRYVPTSVEHNSEKLLTVFKLLKEDVEQGRDRLRDFVYPMYALARSLDEEYWHWSVSYLQSHLTDPPAYSVSDTDLPWLTAFQTLVTVHARRDGLQQLPNETIEYMRLMYERGWGMQVLPWLLVMDGHPAVNRSEYQTWKSAYASLLASESRPALSQHSVWKGAGTAPHKATTSVGQLDGDVQAAQEPMNVYPNPFNPTTRIEYRVPHEAMVMVEVYGIDGRRVRSLHNGRLTPGSYGHTLDASDLATGIYLVRLSIDGALHTRKITLIK